MAATIINRLKKTGQEITVKDRLGAAHTGKVNWFDDEFFSIIEANGDEIVFAHASIACFSIEGGHEKRAMNRSDEAAASAVAEDADF